jgi:hypothetical protein
MNERKEEKKSNRKLLAIIALFGVAFIALDSALALAAYFTVSYDALNINTTTEAIGSTYFSGGTGTESDPYILKSATHLRNLQKLNSLGLFSSSTNFRVDTDSWNNNTITWDGDPLLPIGSDDQPFEGTFDGNGKTITNLVVDGFNTWDIGMFGYVAITGTIKNFFLDHPTIVVGTNTDGGNADSTNPLNGLKTAAQNLATPVARGSSSGLTWTNGTSSSTITGLNTSVSATINNQATTFAIDWSSSNTALLSYDTTAGAWITHATSSSTSPTKDIYTAMLTGRVYATVNGRLAPYTLERYEVSILGNGLISDGTVSITSGGTKMIQGMFKTIWPLDENNSSTDFHSIHVGFFCGHLDGNATYLGLVGGNSESTSQNGTIVVSGRIAQSSTTLVGRCRGDDIRDGTGSNQFGHTYDFTKAPTSSWTSYSAASNNNYSSVSDFTYQMNDMRTLSGKYGSGTSTDVYKYMRIYPGARHMTYLENTYPGVFNITGVHALRMNAGLCGAAYTTPTYNRYLDGNNDPYYYIGTTYYDVPTGYQCNFNVINRYAVSNGFWVYCKGDEADLVNTITGRNQFTINFRIVYIANGSYGNAWQILYNAMNYQISTTQTLYSESSYTNKTITYTDSYMQNCLWYDLHKPYTYSSGTAYSRLMDGNNYVSLYDPVAIIPDGQIHEANVTVTISRTASDFWSAYFDTQESDSTWYPCLAIGIGDNSQVNNMAVDSVQQRNTNYSLWKGETGYGSAKQRGPNDNNDHFYNSYFNVNGSVNVDILSFQSVFTNAYGNVANNMKNVDYIYTKSDCTFDSNTKTFTSWNASSGVKLAFNVTAQLTGSNATFYYYRETGSTGADAKVHALYTNSSYLPSNADGYTAATIGAA